MVAVYLGGEARREPVDLSPCGAGIAGDAPDLNWQAGPLYNLAAPWFCGRIALVSQWTGVSSRPDLRACQFAGPAPVDRRLSETEMGTDECC